MDDEHKLPRLFVGFPVVLNLYRQKEAYRYFLGQQTQELRILIFSLGKEIVSRGKILYLKRSMCNTLSTSLCLEHLTYFSEDLQAVCKHKVL